MFMDYKKELIKVIEKINDRVLAERLYVFVKRFIKNWEGAWCMSYKEKIIALLDKVDDEYILKRVYKLLTYLYLKEE